MTLNEHWAHVWWFSELSLEEMVWEPWRLIVEAAKVQYRTMDKVNRLMQKAIEQNLEWDEILDWNIQH